MNDAHPPGRTKHLRYDPTADEVGVVAWPLVFRARVANRVEGSGRYPWLVLIAALSGLFVTNYTFTILAVSLGRIASDVHTSTSLATWAITGGMLAGAIAGPALGKLGDRFGHRRLYLAGMFVASIAAGLTAVAWNVASLIVFRVVATIAGAAIGPAASAAINRAFGRGERVKAMGYFSLVGAGSPVIGLIIGGYVIDHFSWRWLFIVQAPLCLVAMVIAYLALPATEAGKSAHFDVAGAAWLGFGVAALLFAINRSGDAGWGSPQVLIGLLLTPWCFFQFVRVERRAVDPVLPLEYLHTRNVVVPLAVQFGTNFAYMGGFILTPMLLRDLFHYSNAAVSTASIARPLAFAAVAPLAGFVATKIGERTAAMAGCVVLVVSMIGFSMSSTDRTVWWVVGSMVLVGIAMGTAQPSLAAAVANAVHEEDMGIAGSTQILSNQVGVVIGIQLMQAVHTAQAKTQLVGSYRLSFLIGGAVALLSMMAASFLRPTEAAAIR